MIKQNIKIATDNVVFGCDNGKLKVLLIKRKIEPFDNNWCLMGSFVDDNETLHDAAIRCLKTEANINTSYIEQLYTFDAINRDPRCRIISTAHMLLVKPSDFKILYDKNASDIKWFDVNDLPDDIGFDHKNIINYSVERLRNKIIYTDIVFHLFNDTFVLKDIRMLYDAILDYKIPPHNNFLKNARTKKVIVPVKKGNYKSAVIHYKFDEKMYKELTKNNVYVNFLT